MVWGFIAIILCMRVIQSVFSKKNAILLPKNAIGYLKYVVTYISIACAFATVLLISDLLINGTENLYIAQTILYASVAGVSIGAACLCSLYNLSQGTMALNSLFSTAGLLIPTVASIFLYGETLKIWHWFAIATFMVGAFLLAGSSKRIYGKFSLKSLASLVLMLFAEGATMLMQKSFGMNVSGGRVSLFSAFAFLAGTMVLLTALCILNAAYKRQGAAKCKVEEFSLFPSNPCEIKLNKKTYGYALILAFAVFVINQLATTSTPLVAAVILFAFINGGATLISTVVGAILFKEKISVRSALGIAIGIGSLILLKL